MSDPAPAVAGAALADPTSRSEGQRSPGPRGRVPLDRRDRVHR